jgi:hypothetical protein
MPIKTGDFFIHEKGRMVAVLDKVRTYRWGEQYIIEEVDRTGHGISCVDVDTEMPDALWQPIGRDEWLRNFGGEQ